MWQNTNQKKATPSRCAAVLNPESLTAFVRARQLLQHRAQGRKTRGGDARLARKAERRKKKALQLQFLPALKIHQSGSLVRAHACCSLDVAISGGLGHGHSQRLGRVYGFHHEFAHQLRPSRFGEQEVGRQAGREFLRGRQLPGQDGIQAGTTRDTQPVERNIPDEFIPMGLLQVLRNLTAQSRLREERGDLMRARLRKPPKFSQCDGAMRDVVYLSGRNPVQANEAETSQSLLAAHQRCNQRLIAQTILQSQNSRGWPGHRRQ